MSTMTEQAAVAAMAAEPRRQHPVSEDCWKILDALRDGRWSATALRLNGLGMLSYRGRISDLRIKHGVEIAADSVRDEASGKLHTTYRVPEHAQARAMHLWRFRTADGYEADQRQGGLF
jgi:hypothetical protein